MHACVCVRETKSLKGRLQVRSSVSSCVLEPGSILLDAPSIRPRTDKNAAWPSFHLQAVCLLHEHLVAQSEPKESQPWQTYVPGLPMRASLADRSHTSIAGY